MGSSRSERKRVFLKDIPSEWENIKAAVLQGSVLDPQAQI